MNKTLSIVGALALATISTAVLAADPAPAKGQGKGPPPPPARGPDMALAVEAAQTAVATCTANGYKVGTTVINSAGVTRVLIAADGAGEGAITSGGRKAKTALALKEPTSVTQDKMTKDKDFADKINADKDMFARAGAIPIMVNGELIGAIGTGGAPGGDKDEACTKAGLDKIQARLK